MQVRRKGCLGAVRRLRVRRWSGRVDRKMETNLSVAVHDQSAWEPYDLRGRTCLTHVAYASSICLGKTIPASTGSRNVPQPAIPKVMEAMPIGPSCCTLPYISSSSVFTAGEGIVDDRKGSGLAPDEFENDGPPGPAPLTSDRIMFWISMVRLRISWRSSSSMDDLPLLYEPLGTATMLDASGSRLGSLDRELVRYISSCTEPLRGSRELEAMETGS